MQTLIEQLILTASDRSQFLRKNEEWVKTNLKDAFERWSNELGLSTTFEVRGMRDAFAAGCDSVVSAYLILDSSKEDQFGLRTWLKSWDVRIDILEQKRMGLAQSMKKSLITKGFKVTLVTKQEIDRAGDVYIAASREIGIH